jgi:DNA repair and recombination RAD54-like protein
LLWTLLKQSPKAGKGTIEKAIVACPASLVRNWANELVKWLGPGAINPLAVDGSLPRAELVKAIRQWCTVTGRGVTQPVIIVSYESLRSLCEELGQTQIGLLLADEAHRLKNAQNNTYKTLDAINVRRRVLLTGTPVQNDLSEYYSLLSFANPGILGTRLEFRKNFENIILRGRDAAASDKEKAKCDEKLKELIQLVNKFVIRRTNDLLTKYCAL